MSSGDGARERVHHAVAPREAGSHMLISHGRPVIRRRQGNGSPRQARRFRLHPPAASSRVRPVEIRSRSTDPFATRAARLGSPATRPPPSTGARPATGRATAGRATAVRDPLPPAVPGSGVPMSCTPRPVDRSWQPTARARMLWSFSGTGGRGCRLDPASGNARHRRAGGSVHAVQRPPAAAPDRRQPARTGTARVRQVHHGHRRAAVLVRSRPDHPPGSSSGPGPRTRSFGSKWRSSTCRTAGPGTRFSRDHGTECLSPGRMVALEPRPGRPGPRRPPRPGTWRTHHPAGATAAASDHRSTVRGGARAPGSGQRARRIRHRAPASSWPAPDRVTCRRHLHRHAP